MTSLTNLSETTEDRSDRPDAIVVAVGPEDCEAAVTYAVDVAQRSGCTVHLVNVLGVPPGVAFSGMYGGAVEISNTAIDQTAALAHRLGGDGLEVTSERIDDSAVVPRLVALAGDARMIVLQHRRLPRIKRLVTGSIVNAVASRSKVAVVSVPEGWQPAAEGRDVTVAVQDVTEAEGLLRVAAEHARLWNARLVVLHSWWLASGYDMVVDDQARQEVLAETEAEFTTVLDKLRADVGEVDVVLHVQHAPPAEAVLDAGENSHLLVLGRRHHLLPLGTHLGPLVRAVLAHSTCPVLLAPEHS